MKLRKAESPLKEEEPLDVEAESDGSDLEEGNDFSLYAKKSQTKTRKELIYSYSIILLCAIAFIFVSFRLYQAQSTFQYLSNQVMELKDELKMITVDTELIPQDEELCCPKSEVYTGEVARLEVEVQVCRQGMNENKEKSGTCGGTYTTCTHELLKINGEISNVISGGQKA